MLLALLGGGAVVAKGMMNAAGKTATAAAGTMVQGASAYSAHRYPNGTTGRTSWLAERMAAGEFDNVHGQRSLRSQTPTQNAYHNTHLPRHYYHQQTHRHKNPLVRSYTSVLTNAELVMTDDYKEFMRANIENTIDREVPFRSYRAEHWPDRERRRVPYFNNPNSCFHSSDIKVNQNALRERPYVQLKKHVIQNQ